jgi:capsular exopolysaccharide synthesis family protein
MAVASTMEQAPVQIVHLADIPAFPDSPKVTRVLAVWVILGAGFGMGLILLFEHLDRTIKSPRTVEETLGLPTLGTIPYLEPAPGRMFQKQRGRAIRLITTLGAKSAEVEAFRYLRTALQYSSAGARPRVIQLTSCTPREGKSTATMNLAIAVAQRGERTLLIDADLKKPVVHQTFGVPRRPGLTDVLTGNRPFAECVQTAEGVEHLDVIPAGPAVPNPADLLDSAAMEELIAKALETYAVVLIDSPPLMGMADAFVLARKVDGVCLVTRAGVTRRDVLAKMVQSLDAMNARLLGVVYNVPKRGRKPSDYYGYYNTMEQDAEDDAPPPSGTATART